MTSVQKHQVIVGENNGEYSLKIKKFLVELLENSNSKSFFIGVSGGSMPTILCPILASLEEKLVDRLKLFVVDERLVPIDSAESNTGIYLKSLPTTFRNNIILVNCLNDAKATAINFEQTLKSLNPPISAADNGFPQFDVLFLGIGPDGHTCSLFPGHPLLEEKSNWICSIENSPKPPPRRITVTLPVLNNAQNIAFMVTGEGKAQVLKDIIEAGNLNYPPALINPKQGKKIIWFLDEAAASNLTKN